MIGVLSKPADRIYAEDIHKLVASKVRKGEQIEFKANLSAEACPPDRWVSGGDQIGNPANAKALEDAISSWRSVVWPCLASSSG